MQIVFDDSCSTDEHWGVVVRYQGGPAGGVASASQVIPHGRHQGKYMNVKKNNDNPGHLVRQNRKLKRNNNDIKLFQRVKLNLTIFN